MKIRAKANGNIIEEEDGRAKQLIEAGIYEAYDEKSEKKKASSTAVAPMTTQGMPKSPKKGKLIK